MGMKSSRKIRLGHNYPILPAILVVLLVVKFLDPYPGWAVLLVGLGSAWLLSYIWARSLSRGLRFRREVRFGWAQVGDRLEERFTLTNHSFFPALWAEIIDHTDMPGYSASAATGVGAYAENSWLTEGVCSKRGQFTHGPTVLRSGDPFGIFTVEITDPTSIDILVTPPITPMHHLKVQVGGWSEEGSPRERSLEKTLDASTVRPYLPGDQRRWIHWRTTARRSELFVRVFSGAPAGDWWIILDLDASVQLGEGQDSILEHAIILVASLADHALHLGKAVGLCINAETPTWLPPKSGDGMRWEILRALALASPSPRNLADFSASLPRSSHRKASYVVITANTESDWFQPFLPSSASSITPTALLLDPETYGGEGDALACRAALHKVGVPAQIIPRDAFDRPDVRPGRQGALQWKVTPSGRAVRHEFHSPSRMEEDRMNVQYESWDGWVLMHLRRILSRIGADFIIQFSLLCVLYSSVIYAVIEMVPRIEASALWQPVIGGMLVGWVTAASRLKSWKAWIIITAAGFCLIAGSLGNLGRSTLETLWWANALATKQYVNVNGTPASFLLELRLLLEQFLNFWGNLLVIISRTEVWIFNLVQANAQFDAMVTVLIWGMSIWLMAAWSSWVLRRRRRPVAAVLPAGIFLSTSMAYTGASVTPLLGLIGSTLLLMAWNGFSRRMDSWLHEGVDYAEDLRLDVNVTAIVLTVVFVLAAWMAPVFSIETIGDLVRRLRPAISSSNQDTARSLGLEIIQTALPKTTEVPARKLKTSLSSSDLPRQHLLGSGPELSEALVMTVSTGELPRLPYDLAELSAQGNLQIPRYYWRAVTYDTYTGHGWQTSLTESVSYPAGEATHPGFILFPDEGRQQLIHPAFKTPGTHLLNQVVTPALDFNGMVFAAGEMLGINNGYRILWRMPPDPTQGPQGDQFAVISLENAPAYLAWSSISRVSASQLLLTEGVPYPDWVLERYLSLPEDLPQRVIQLSQDVTAGAGNAYQKSVALQTYLRSIPYSLDLPLPPSDQDVVDYFLFDLKQGYCDYYASAMVVMARAVGLPARLVIGYASGDYNPEKAVYSVSEANGHSWPEIYFPGYGWVEFEPTAGLPEIERPAGDLPEMAELAPLVLPAPQTLITPRDLLPLLAVFAGVTVLVMAAWLASEPTRLMRMAPSKSVQAVFKRLYRGSKRIGYEPHAGDTPKEYAQRLAQKLVDSPFPVLTARWFEGSKQALDRIANAYSYSIYSHHRLTYSDRERVLGAWNWLRWRLYIGRLLRSRKTGPADHDISMEK